MIKVICSNDYKKIEVFGHANYAEYGNDIVCASVSSIIGSSVNLALNFNKNVNYNDDGNKITIINDTNDENVYKTLENMIVCLNDLADQYPKNIKISKGE